MRQRNREAQKKKERVVVINVRTFAVYALLIVMSLLALAALLRYAFGFLSVKNIELVGDFSYDREQIIEAAGVRRGEALYRLDCDELEERILRECPYLETVTVKPSFPNTLRMVLQEKRAAWYITLAGDCYALDDELLVIEETANVQKFINGGVPRLTLPSVKRAVVGETLVYGENETEIRYAEELMEKAKMTSFKTRLTLLDIENRFEIHIEVDGKFRVYMGTLRDLEEKLEAVEKALEDPRLDGATGAEIDASDPSQIYIRMES
ncbi:MAG: FtsQ-type POTRA domain-containing protein [Ruminococcaceae bacterium]|nr:FtsQ-type POTRA domain-containing protein [Oscillospiraceae bacterium]